MSTRSSRDRESFRKLLASIFSMQESGVDAQSLTVLLELERAIATGAPDVNRAMQLVADRARHVANAAGIAIALRRGDQLVYRAGSGCAASYVGRQMTAILSVSERDEARSEILRVEDVQADARIEAAICRQFEAQALLILPIYNECAVAGVLEVLFSEPHAFQDREMRAYRLMAELLGEALSRDLQLDQQTLLATQAATLPYTTEQTASQRRRLPGDAKSMLERTRRYVIRHVCGAVSAVVSELKAVKPLLHEYRWSVAVTGMVIVLLIAACWIAYSGQPVSPAGTLSLQEPNSVQQQIPLLPVGSAPSNPASKLQTTAGEAQEETSPGLAFKRIRRGPNEIDYVAEDVTIRHFMARPAVPRVRGAYKELYIGEDVTVRYPASTRPK